MSTLRELALSRAARGFGLRGNAPNATVIGTTRDETQQAAHSTTGQDSTRQENTRDAPSRKDEDASRHVAICKSNDAKDAPSRKDEDETRQVAMRKTNDAKDAPSRKDDDETRNQAIRKINQLTSAHLPNWTPKSPKDRPKIQASASTPLSEKKLESADSKTEQRSDRTTSDAARQQREAERLRALLSSRTNFRPLLGAKTPKSDQSSQQRPEQSPICDVRSDSAKAAVRDEDKGHRGSHPRAAASPRTYVRPPVLGGKTPKGAQASQQLLEKPSPVSDVHSFPAKAAVRDEDRSSSDTDEYLEASAHRRQSARNLPGNRDVTRRLRAEVDGQRIRRPSENISPSKLFSMQKQLHQSPQLEHEGFREEYTPAQYMTPARAQDLASRARRSDTFMSDSTWEARLEEIDGMLNSVLHSNEPTSKDDMMYEAIRWQHSASRSTPSPFGTRHGDARADQEKKEMFNGELTKEEREIELQRASRHVANRLASAFDSEKKSEKIRSRSPVPSPEWIARHTYSSLIKAHEGCKSCEMLGSFVQQRDDKIRELQSDLVAVNKAKQQLSEDAQTLRETVESLQKLNLHNEFRLERCVDVCRWLKDEVNKFAVELKDSESAFVKQSELVHNLRTEAEATNKLCELREATLRSEIASLQSQLASAHKSPEKKLKTIESQISNLLQLREEDHRKFAESFRRAAGREALLADKNRQMKKDLESALLQAVQKERTDKQLQQSTNTLRMLATAVDSYEHTLKELSAERATIQDQHEALVIAVDSYRHALDTANTRQIALESENVFLHNEIVKLKDFAKEEKSFKNEGMNKQLESLQRVKTVYQLTINELSESSLRANQGLNDNFDKERTQLLENIQIVSQQRDELANSIVELKKLVVTLETDLKSLQQARAADAVTMKLLQDSCEFVKSEHDKRIQADANAACSRHDCMKLREQTKVLRENIVQLMRKQRHHATDETSDKSRGSKAFNSSSHKERMESLIVRIVGMTDDATTGSNAHFNSSEPSVILEALQEWNLNESNLRLQRAECEHASNMSKVESERERLRVSLRACQRRCDDLESKLAGNEAALFQAEEAAVTAKEEASFAKMAAEKMVAHSHKECHELQEMMLKYESKFRKSTRTNSVEAKAQEHRFASMQNTVAVLSRENEDLMQSKAQLQDLLAEQEQKISIIVKERDSLQRTLDLVSKHGGSRGDESSGNAKSAPGHTGTVQISQLASTIRTLLDSGAPATTPMASQKSHAESLSAQGHESEGLKGTENARGQAHSNAQAVQQHGQDAHARTLEAGHPLQRPSDDDHEVQDSPPVADDLYLDRTLTDCSFLTAASLSSDT